MTLIGRTGICVAFVSIISPLMMSSIFAVDTSLAWTVSFFWLKHPIDARHAANP
jgi:hypothetical protein